MEITPKIRTTIDEVLDNFDFERVEKVMQLLNWTWGSGTNAEVPDIARLRTQARKLLQDCFENRPKGREEIDWSSSTGGFVAQSITYDDEDFRLSLVFELTSYDADTEEE